MSIWSLNEALDWLDTKDVHHTRLGLERINALVNGLGLPPPKSTVHIAGTNGKGSVCAFTASILASAGFRTGMYTSPHLVEMNERFISESGPISNEDFAAGLMAVKEADMGLDCSYFEALTSLFFWWQKRAGLEHTVLETGMGGRLDATNLALPRVSVITPIALEHTEHLGKTVEAIAGEKAGIIKEERPVVVSRMEPKAMKVIEDRCQQTLSPLIRSDRGVDVRPIGSFEKRDGRWGQVVEIVTTLGEYGEVFIPLLGSHQRMNALTAIRTAEVLRRQGLDITDNHIREGIRKARWPARIELVDGPKPMILDVTHNPHGARVLANELMRLMTSLEMDTSVVILGMMKEKDVDGVLRELTRLRGTIICTTPQTPRAMPSDELASRAREIGGSGLSVVEVPDVGEAVEKARFHGELMCLTGSFYTVGEGMQSMGIKPAILREW